MNETLKKAAQTALDVQDACNLTGVIRAWFDASCAAKQDDSKTHGYKVHPIDVLFLSKITSLMVVNANCIGSVEAPPDHPDLFGPAYAWALEVTKGGG